MANIGIPSASIAAATSSCVLSGLEAQRASSAPPALRVAARLAVSVVMCRQADILAPLRGFSLAKLSRISRNTGISRDAHSILSLPSGARAGSLTSPPVAFFAPTHISFLWLACFQAGAPSHAAERRVAAHAPRSIDNNEL